MKKYDVNIKADTWYCSIEAKNKEEAIEKALGWFLEYEPEIYVEPSAEEQDDEGDWKCCRCKCIDMDTEDKIYCCNNCREYDHFIPADEEMELNP